MILFYLLSILFIWNEIYSFSNYDKLGTKINVENFDTFNKLDFLYYSSKIIYWIWILIGCMIGSTPFYIILISSILKVPAYFIGLKFYRKYSLINIFISLGCLFYILFTSLSF